MEKQKNETVQRVNGLSNDLNMLYHQAARKLGVPDSILCVLYVIYEKGDHCLLHEICMDSGLSKQTINSAIRKLEQDDILYLKQDKGKSKCVCLTENGKRYIKKTAARLYEAEGNAFGDWTQQEREAYLRLMKKYIDSLQAELEKMKGCEI